MGPHTMPQFRTFIEVQAPPSSRWGISSTKQHGGSNELSSFVFSLFPPSLSASTRSPKLAGLYQGAQTASRYCILSVPHKQSNNRVLLALQRSNIPSDCPERGHGLHTGRDNLDTLRARGQFRTLVNKIYQIRATVESSSVRYSCAVYVADACTRNT